MKQWLPALKQRGIILATVLLFLSLLSLLGIHSLQSSLLQTKLSQHFQQSVFLFDRAEAALQIAEQQVRTAPCRTSTQVGPNDIIVKHSTWWLSAITCKIAAPNLHLRFFIQALGTNNCDKLASSLKPGVNYYRATVWVADSALSHQVLLQSTYATQAFNLPTVAKASLCRYGHTIKSGRLSWRQLL